MRRGWVGSELDIGTSERVEGMQAVGSYVVFYFFETDSA